MAVSSISKGLGTMDVLYSLIGVMHFLIGCRHEQSPTERQLYVRDWIHSRDIPAKHEKL